jgi:hypothetical protein
MVATATLMTGCSSSYDNPQAWCSISSLTGSTQCFYSTQAQCMATISGIGGNCVQNPDYIGNAPRPRRALQRAQ